MTDAPFTDLPVRHDSLPAPVAEAVRRAAFRISDRTKGDNYIPSVSAGEAEDLITEELRPVLLGGPLPPIDPAPVIGVTTAKTDEAIRQWIAKLPTTGDAVKIDAFRGCIASKPCHRCKVVWHSGICVCGLTHCYRCGHWLRGEGDTKTYERINADHYDGPKAEQIDPLFPATAARFSITSDGRVIPAS